jgi:hypothetical protein
MVRGGGRYPTFFAPYEPKMAWATVPPALPLGKILAIPPDVDYENWDEEDEEMLLLMM